MELRDLVVVLREVDWHQLGIQLNVPKYILRNIERENPHDEARKLSEMLEYWKKNEKNTFWSKIIEALERIDDHKNIIAKIQSKYEIRKPPHTSLSASTDSQLHDESRSSAVTGRPISLEDRLSMFSSQLLDCPCTDAHLVKLCRSIMNWRDLSPYLRLTPAEETRIVTSFPAASHDTQCTEMFKTWKKTFGMKANYR